MRKVNYLLIIGTFILLFLMAISMFPDYFTQVDPYGKQYERLAYEEGKFKGGTPPIAPCKEFPWGTDTLGRDMKSLIIYGCKTTLLMTLLISLGRLLIALPLSILAAYKNKLAGWTIKEFNIIFSAFPLIVLCAFFGQTNLSSALFINEMTPVVIMLTVFGWGKLANVITQKVTEILSKDFIEGEISIGKNKLEIALQNILPHLIPNLIVFAFLEMALILVSLAQIGILTTIVRGEFFNIEGNMNTPLAFDWPSLFIYSYYLFGSDKTWLILYPALAFATGIIGFNLFGEGLRLEFDKKNSRVISFIKKIPTILSPARFIYEIKNYKDYRSSVIRKTISIALIIVIAAIPQQQNLYKLDVQNTLNDTEVFNQFKSEDMIAPDFEMNYANVLSKKLEEFGVLPFDDSYIHEFRAEKKQVLDSNINISFDNKSIDLKYKIDYRFMEYAPLEVSCNMEVLEVDKIRSTVKERAKELEEKVIAVDGTAYFKSNFYIEGDVKPKAFIYILPKTGHFVTTDLSQDEGRINSILMESEKSEELLSQSEAKINIKVKTGYRGGVNVIGYIPGCDEQLKDEYIVIGCPINYLQNNTEVYRTTEIGGSTLAFEIAKAIQKYGIKPKRTIVFAFWGGDKSLSRGTVDFVKKYFKFSDKTAFYIDLKDLTNIQTNDISVDTSLVMPKNKIGQEYVKTLKQYAGINDIKLSYGSIESFYAKDFYDSNRQAIVISSSRKSPFFDKLYKDNGEINQEKFSKASQMIFSTIVEMALGGEGNE